MATAALSNVGVPLMGIAADLAMGMFFAPATHVGVMDRAPRERLTDAARDSIRVGQGGRCAKCGTRFYAGNMEIDHRWPIAKGGQNWMVNLQALCRSCNRSKGAKLEPVVLDVLTGAFDAGASSGMVQVPKEWLSKMEFGNLMNAANLTGQVGALVPFMAISPTTALVIVGGVVLVVVGFFAVRWLLEHADGERRYLRLARSMRETMSGVAYRVGHLTRHLEGVPDQARHTQTQIGDATRRASTFAGITAGRAQRAGAQHVPRIASTAWRQWEQAARVPGHLASRVPDDMGATARRFARSTGPAVAHVQDKIGSVTGSMPRIGKRETAPAADDGEVAAGRWV